jgi:long-subunit acyl-CoA synthetase (AMP-forming)
MPGVQVRLLSSTEEDVTDKIGQSGEIQVRGDNIFVGYWKDDIVTEKEHCFDGEGNRWFKVRSFKSASSFKRRI